VIAIAIEIPGDRDAESSNAQKIEWRDTLASAEQQQEMPEEGITITES
jgi:hypothetical protein